MKGAEHCDVLYLFLNYKMERKSAEHHQPLKRVHYMTQYGSAGDEAFKKIADEINELKDRQLEERHRKQLAENYEQRITDMDEFLQENTVKLVEFDNELVRRIVSRINVLSVDRIQIQLKSGIIMEEELV